MPEYLHIMDARSTILDEQLAQLASRFGVRALRPIQTHRNLVFFATRRLGEDAVLKVRVSDALATAGLGHLRGELEFMEFLHCKGVRVPVPYRSSTGQLVECARVGSSMLCACCLERIEGETWGERPHSLTDVEHVGELAGQMAAVAGGFKACGQSGRPSWRDAAWLSEPERAIHPSMRGVVTQAVALRTQLEALPADAFGLVHDDLHSGNVVFADGSPVAIDFENSHYTWHVSEVASALFFHLWKTRRSDAAELVDRASAFLTAFLTGYRLRHTLEPFWIGQIPLFLKLRELSMFASSGLQQADFDTVGAKDDHFAFLKENLEEAVPCVEMDFGRFA